MTTYYYPSTYGAAEAPAQNGAAGTASFTGNLPAEPAGSYIVVTPNAVAAGATPTYTVTFDYTGAGTGVTETVSQTNYHNGTYNETTDGTYDFLIANMAIPANDSYTFTGASSTYTPAATIATTDPTCFCTGTAIRTVDGDVAVEALRVGDRVVTASGGTRVIRWIGRRTLVPDDHATPSALWPVRIRAGAFGTDEDGVPVPSRALRLSPGHPVLVGTGPGEALVPIMCLINGTSVERERVTSVTYWHVEIEGAHDILLAEGLPAESYLDWGDRVFFDEASALGIANPDHVPPGLGARCRPVVLDGTLVEAERRRLDALFERTIVGPCAWPSMSELPTGF